MATKSILKDITIKDKHTARNFVNALENAANKKSEEVIISRTTTTLPKDKVRSFFGKE